MIFQIKNDKFYYFFVMSQYWLIEYRFCFRLYDITPLQGAVGGAFIARFRCAVFWRLRSILRIFFNSSVKSFSERFLDYTQNISSDYLPDIIIIQSPLNQAYCEKRPVQPVY